MTTSDLSALSPERRQLISQVEKLTAECDRLRAELLRLERRNAELEERRRRSIAIWERGGA